MNAPGTREIPGPGPSSGRTTGKAQRRHTKQEMDSEIGRFPFSEIAVFLLLGEPKANVTGRQNLLRFVMVVLVR